MTRRRINHAARRADKAFHESAHKADPATMSDDALWASVAYLQTVNRDGAMAERIGALVAEKQRRRVTA